MVQIRLVILALAAASQSYTAINATTQWYIRNGGAATNGGGFDATLGGTNRANQDACQVTIDNAAITATVNASTITFTGGYTATAADVGNVVNIFTSTGGTPPVMTRYVITAQGGTTWTTDIDTTAVTATITSACMGGSFADLGDWVLPNGRANGVSSTGTWKVWVKGGSTYTTTSSATWTMDAPVTGTPQVTIEGYTTTTGDGGRFTLTSSTNSVGLLTDLTGSTNWAIVNANLTHTAATRGICIQPNDSGDSITVKNVVMDGCSYGINADNVGARYPASGIYVLSSEIKNCTSDCILMYATTAQVHNLALVDSWVHDAVGVGVAFSTQTPVLRCYRSVVSDNGSHGISWNAAASTTSLSLVEIDGCNFYSNVGDGFRAAVGSIAAVGPAAYSIRCAIAYGNGGYGFNITASTLLSSTFLQFGYNAYGTNTSGNLNNITAGTGDVTLTADPFVSATNFALNATAGGGAALKGACSNTLPFTATNNRDIGADQTSGGSGGAMRATGSIH